MRLREPRKRRGVVQIRSPRIREKWPQAGMAGMKNARECEAAVRAAWGPMRMPTPAELLDMPDLVLPPAPESLGEDLQEVWDGFHGRRFDELPCELWTGVEIGLRYMGAYAKRYYFAALLLCILEEMIKPEDEYRLRKLISLCGTLSSYSLQIEQPWSIPQVSATLGVLRLSSVWAAGRPELYTTSFQQELRKTVAEIESYYTLR
jgi:hypothetical protein